MKVGRSEEGGLKRRDNQCSGAPERRIIILVREVQYQIDLRGAVRGLRDLDLTSAKPR